MRVMRALGVVELDGRRQVVVTAHSIRTFFDIFLNDLPASDFKNFSDDPEVELLR
jgi:hypothetical protein